ncbi:MAG: tetratricopeptide repeat protein [Akkermansiaceae bacterium]|nr:tetratricopeptide repeat protein [Akkermansiaceae bacterium]MCP5548578.1 tetratricopeptide repeat protein [Akkermansiaceae bacterium]
MSQDIQDSSTPLAEISQGPSAFEQFLDRNQKNLVILGILIALAAAGWVVYDGIQTGARESAGEDLNKADDLAALQSVIKTHQGTPAEGSAHVLLAERQWAEGQQDAAIETLRSFIDSEPSHPAVPNAKASLAAKSMAQGKSDEAKSLFSSLAESDEAGFLAPYALISLGDIALAAGDKEAAKNYYQQARNEHPSSPFANTASERTAIVDAAAPTEIDPPPAPEPDPAAPSATGAQPPFSITPVPNALEPAAPSSEAPASTEETPDSTGADAPAEPAAGSQEESPAEEAPPADEEQ